jgi:hypothetical protein
MVRSYTHRQALSALVIGAAFGAVAFAQQQQQFAAALQANQSALRQYTWQSRTELRVEGEVKQVRLEQVRFDLDGRLQKTTIGGGTASADAARPGPPGPAGAVRKRVVAQKKEEFQQMLAELGALAESYAHMTPARMSAFATRAVITPGQGIETGSARIQGRDVVIPGDRMTIWIDPIGSAMRRIEIATFYEGRPVSIAADYRRLENGLTYQARSTLRYAEKGVEVAVETFDYARSATR